MTWPEMKVESWDKYVEIANKLDVGPPHAVGFVLRGQPRANDALRPSLLRLLPEKANRTKAVELETVLKAEFVAQAHLHLAASDIPRAEDLISWWTLMQHHRAPTRLIDWTKSPYVAAYFASISNPDEDGAVWLFAPGNLEAAMKAKHQTPDFSNQVADNAEFFRKACDLRHLFLVERVNRTHRMVVQQGGFTLACDVLADHGELIASALGDNAAGKLQFKKLVLPAKLKPLFLRRLRRMNVTAAALFPGADGLGKSIRELAVLEAPDATA